MTHLIRVLRDERGFTVAELMMTVFLMGIVLAIVYTTLDTFVKTSNATQSKSFSLAEARGGLERVAKHVRAANPIDPISPVSRYENEIQFSVYCSTPGVKGCGANNLRSVVYRVANNTLTETAGGLSSTVMGPQGPVTVPQTQRRGALVNPAGQPVFRYFDKNGQPLATSGVGAPPATTFRDCARSVEIHLVVISEHRKPQSTIDLATRVDLRNHTEMVGC